MQHYCILSIFASMLQTMFKRFTDTYIDILGAVASITCAVHCTLVPLLLTLGTLGGLSWMTNHSIEFSFLLISAGIAGITMFVGYRRQTMSKRTILIFALGFGLLLLGRWFHHDHTHVHTVAFLVTACGGLTIASAHVVNWLAQRKKMMVEL